MNTYYSHPKRKTKVLFVQLGSPKDPSPRELRRYLRQFLGDPRVVDINPWVWKIILNFLVLPFRPRKSSKLYARIWNGTSFPLITNTADFTHKVSDELAKLDTDKLVEVNHAFLLSQPLVSDIYDSWERDLENGVGATKLLIIPMFPQYSESTIGSGVDALAKELSKRVKIPNFELITNFHRTKSFINNSVYQIEKKVQELTLNGIEIDSLILSFHGMQKRRVLFKGDNYYRHCYETFRLITSRLGNICSEKVIMTFQSRFGSEEWITPYTDEVVKELIEKGKREIAVYAPSFVVDCLETTDEIGHELVNNAKQWGGNIYPIQCLNANEQWCKDFAEYTFIQAEGSAQEKEDLEYQLSDEEYRLMPRLTMTK